VSLQRARRALADTSALVAAVNRSDGSHLEAVGIQRRIAREGWQLIMSNFILAETHGLIVGRMGRAAGLAFLDYARSGAVHTVRVEERDEEAARTIIRRYTDKAFSYTDATSFAIMERLGIRYAFSFDDYFERYGFERLA
jgi:predicted nucleic acid-binding protein